MLVLDGFWDTGKFTSSWIISTDDPARSLADLKLFAHKILGVSGLPLENNPDFRIVERGLNTAKNEAKYISVDQVRELQHFMNSTSAVSNCKIAVIYEADLMNLNAYNCCLKILEEASRPGNIIATIKSRCVKVSDFAVSSSSNSANCHPQASNCHPREGGDPDNIELDPRLRGGDIMGRGDDNMLQLHDITQKMKYLQEISHKDSKELWQGFCDNVLYYLRKKADIKRFDHAQKLIKDTADFDLDKRHMGILIMECLA